MQNIREFNKKISSLKSTMKITKTMKLIATTKFRKVHKAQANASFFAANLSGLMSRLASGVDKVDHPLLAGRSGAGKVLVVVFTSDRGLCGGFNNNQVRAVKKWITVNKEKYQRIDLAFCGKKGYLALSKVAQVFKYYERVTVDPKFIDAERIVNDLSAAFAAEDYDEVYLAYNVFKSPIAQYPTFEKLLPIDPAVMEQTEHQLNTEYLVEPNLDKLVNDLIPRYAQYRIYAALLENAAGEHGARMSAMDNASKNCQDLIHKYTHLRNQARQASITTELIEITSGAEALK